MSRVPTALPDEIREKVELHVKWLDGDPKGRPLHLTGTNLSHLNLSGIDLRGARLNGVSFRMCDLDRAAFHTAFLTACTLEDANLTHAAFVGANIFGCHFDGAALTLCDFDAASITATSFANTIGLDVKGALIAPNTSCFGAVPQGELDVYHVTEDGDVLLVTIPRDQDRWCVDGSNEILTDRVIVREHVVGGDGYEVGTSIIGNCIPLSCVVSYNEAMWLRSTFERANRCRTESGKRAING